MMAEIINFADLKDDPHISGQAFCIHCDHEWVAVAPSGTVDMECPKCHTMKGLFKYPCAPSDGQETWECNCGNQLFYIRPEGHLCPNCGIYQSYE